MGIFTIGQLDICVGGGRVVRAIRGRIVRRESVKSFGAKVMARVALLRAIECMLTIGRRGKRHSAPAFGAIVLSATLMGCAIHPVQQDVTGFRNVDISDRIRCETRLAIQDKAIELLSQQPKQTSRKLAERLKEDRSLFMKDPRPFLDDKEKAFYERYIRTGIAYDFTFNIVEVNKASLAADPLYIITNGTAGLGLAGSGEYSRGNERRYALTDTFEGLLKDPRLPCDEDYRYKNFSYPIAGNVGMGELIGSFIDLNEDKDLVPVKVGEAQRVFADTMTFLTTVSGSANPHIVLTPVGGRVGLAAGAGFAFSSSRADTHKMIIGLSMESRTILADDKVSRQAGKRLDGRKSLAPFFAEPGPARKPVSGGQVGRTSTELQALDAIRQQRLDSFYDRLGTTLR